MAMAVDNSIRTDRLSLPPSLLEFSAQYSGFKLFERTRVIESGNR